MVAWPSIEARLALIGGYILSYDDEAQEQIQKLFSSTDKIFLMAAGCGVCAGLPLMDGLTDKVLSDAANGTKEVLDEVKKELEGNIEDVLSHLINYLAIAERLKDDTSAINIGSQTFNKTELRTAINDIKRLVAEIILKERKTTQHHFSFVKAVHRAQRPGRGANASPTHYVVLNYDSLLEDALGYEGLTYADGMSVGATGRWSPAELFKPDLQARVLKLHGSLDWYGEEKSEVIRRLPPHMAKELGNQRIIIAPAESKYAETQSEPYSTLMQSFDALLKSQSKSTLDKSLFILGYGFGDAHVNRRIERALQYNENLTVVVLTNITPDKGILKKWSENPSTNERLVIYAEQAFISNGIKRDLAAAHDWWKFEKFTELVGEAG